MTHHNGLYEKYIKRALDFVCALIACIILSPLILIIAVMVRIKLGNPVLFSQERPGLDGKIFKLYKFRTMTDKKDDDGQLLPDEQRRHQEQGLLLLPLGLSHTHTRLEALSLDELLLCQQHGANQHQ